MDKKELNVRKLVLIDLKTYITYYSNQNYKIRLLEAYHTLKDNNVKSEEDLLNKKIDIGAFTYDEVTMLDRLSDEIYRAMLASSLIEITSIMNLPNNYGDMLADANKKIK